MVLRIINKESQLYFMSYTGKITLSIKSQEFADITSQVKDMVSKSGIMSGTCNVFASGATCAVMVNENEPMLLHDIKEALERISPKDRIYSHSANAHSHIRAAILGCDKTIPVSEGELVLGTWQSIMVGNFDVSERDREITVTVVGE